MQIVTNYKYILHANRNKLQVYFASFAK